MTTPKSISLFHFTGSLESLEGILHKGFYPYYSLEDVSCWGLGSPHNFIAFPVVCFCDIPLARISDHVSFYGKYGIGMSKKWALRKGLNPVIYLSEKSLCANSLTETVMEVWESPGKDSAGHALNMMAYVKPIEGKMYKGGKKAKKEFYMENEWRYVPQHKNIHKLLWMEDYKDKNRLSESNAKAQKLGCLKFAPSDVRYIFVKSDSDIPRLVDYINQKLERHSSRHLKILTTRITSLEHIDKDV